MTRHALMPLAVAAAVVALSLSPAAAAHGGGGLGFRSTVERTEPPLASVTVEVLDFDDRLELVNDSDRTLTILGYENERYLEFRPDGVYQNIRSPAVYLNDDRYGEVELPAEADPKAPPVWEKVASDNRFDWHDHRIHWMSRTLPPKVARARDTAQRVFDWSIPGRLGKEPFAIVGTLDYEPQSGSPVPYVYVIPPAVLLIAASILWTIRRTRRERR